MGKVKFLIFNSVLACGLTAFPVATLVTQRGMSNYVNSAVGVAISNQTAELLTSYNFVSYSNMANYVQSMIRASVSNVSEQIVESSENVCTNDGQYFYWTHSYIDYSGASQRETIKFNITSTSRWVDGLGCEIVGSTLSDYPTGTIFAVVNGGSNIVCAALKNATTNYFNLETNHFYHAAEATPETSNEWLHAELYGYPDVTEWEFDGYYIVNTNGYYKFDSLNDGGDKITVAKYTVETNGEKNIMGSFTVKAKRLTASQVSAAIGDTGHTAATNNTWAELAPPILTNITISLEQVLDESVSKCSPFNILSFFISTAQAANSGGSCSLTITVTGPYCEMYAQPECDSDHYWDKDPWYRQEDWNNPANWSLGISKNSKGYYLWPITYVGRDGNTYTEYQEFSSLSQLSTLAGVSIPSLPPSPYVAPVLKERARSCQKIGHCYGKNCTCVQCGVKRDHDFQFVNPGECMRCQNKISKLDKSGDDYKIIETAEVCGKKCNLPDLSKHRGWYNQNTDSDTYNCSCECGYYSTSQFQNAHDFPKPEDGNPNYTWTDSGDGTHYCLVDCNRDCGKEDVKVSYSHSVDPDSNNTSYERIDESTHKVIGVCQHCGANVDTVEGHFSNDGTCECPCGEEWHTSPENPPMFCAYAGAGDCGFTRCAVCNKLINSPVEGLDADGHHEISESDSGYDTANNHQYGCYRDPDGYNDDGSVKYKINKTHHHCVCGSFQESHQGYSVKTANGYYFVCSICGYGENPDDREYYAEDPFGVDPRCPLGYKRNEHSSTWDGKQNRGSASGHTCAGCENSTPDGSGPGTGWVADSNYFNTPISDTLRMNDDGTYTREITYKTSGTFYWGGGGSPVYKKKVSWTWTESYDFSM